MLTTSSTRAMKKIILAMEAAPAAIPPKPSTAAIMAIMRNVTVQRNMILSFWGYVINVGTIVPCKQFGFNLLYQNPTFAGFPDRNWLFGLDSAKSLHRTLRGVATSYRGMFTSI